MKWITKIKSSIAEGSDFKSGSFKDILDGKFLSKENFAKQLPYILFCTLLCFFYIGNRFHCERTLREISSLEKELKELRYEAITTASELMSLSRQSEVCRLVEKNDMELKESLVPPRQLVVNE